MDYMEAEDRAGIFIGHSFEEYVVDLGEIRMNYAVAGDDSRPALLLIPAQGESWWGYEKTMPLLSGAFQVFAVDLRGQGRSTWTPGRYTLDNLGNDLVRFIDTVVRRPVVVSGLSSGGTVAAWLAAFAKPGQIRAAVFEDSPLFASEGHASIGPSVDRAAGPIFALWSKWLGDQWSIGDWEGMVAALPRELPAPSLRALGAMSPPGERPAGIPQDFLEYDPEWGKAFANGTATAACDHENMLEKIRVPVLLTHHFHEIDEETGMLLGAISDAQVDRVRNLVTGAGQPFSYRSFPEMPHSMHGTDPELFASTVLDWCRGLALADAEEHRNSQEEE